MDLQARIVDSFPPLYKLESELKCEKHLMAKAKAKFMKIEKPVGPEYER